MIRATKTRGGKTRWKARHGGHGEQRTFDRKADAQDWLDDHRRGVQKVKAGLDADAGPILFRDLVGLWEANFNPSAWRLEMVKPSLERWGTVHVREMKPQGIGAWLHELTGQRGQALSEKTKSHYLETLRQVLNAGVEWNYLDKSPARARAFKAPSPSSRVRPIRPFASWTEVLRVAEQCSPVGSALVRFCCATGLRIPGEVISLQWSQVDRKEKLLRVEGTKTENAPRTIPLSRHALEALNDLPRRLSGSVFGGKKGERFDYRGWRRNEWRKALVLAGLDDRTPYEMRHTFATLALEQGATLAEIAEVLGHSDIGITRRYYVKWTRPMADRLRKVLDSIGEEKVVESGSPEALHTA